MAVETLFSEIDLSNDTLSAINLSGKHSFYLISVAEDDKVSSITFGVYIDSGVKNNPLLIQYITLPVSVGISGQRWSGFPDSFYLKPTQVTLKNGGVKKGNIDGQPYQVEVNLNPIDLG